MPKKQNQGPSLPRETAAERLERARKRGRSIVAAIDKRNSAIAAQRNELMERLSGGAVPMADPSQCYPYLMYAQMFHAQGENYQAQAQACFNAESYYLKLYNQCMGYPV